MCVAYISTDHLLSLELLILGSMEMRSLPDTYTVYMCQANFSFPYCLGLPSRNGYLVRRSKVEPIVVGCHGRFTLSPSLKNKQQKEKQENTFHVTETSVVTTLPSSSVEPCLNSYIYRFVDICLSSSSRGLQG